MTSNASPTQWLDEVAWNEAGLVPAIAQDVVSGRVLMQAWMNRQALSETVREGYAVYWSRSRARLWRKGERSGHRQRVQRIRLDCDGDTVLLSVTQEGEIACHTGRESCFYRTLTSQGWVVADPVLKSPDEIYRA